MVFVPPVQSQIIDWPALRGSAAICMISSKILSALFTPSIAPRAPNRKFSEKCCLRKAAVFSDCSVQMSQQDDHSFCSPDQD
jgi:hypothetical protein